MDFADAAKTVENARNAGKLVVLVGRCRVKYEGRAASKISEGDRLVVIKADGSFLVHQGAKMAAINYQGPGSAVKCEVNEENKELIITSSRPVKNAAKNKPKINEKIEVHFSGIAFAGAFGLKDDEQIKVFGSERQLSDLLMEDLNLIEPGLRPLQKESALGKGIVDVFAEDAKGRLVIIEVKRRSAQLDAVSQLSRYVEEVRQRKGKEVRGILVAPSASESAAKMLEKAGLEFFKLDYEIGNPSAKIKGLQKKQKILGEY